jgi:hypothetical protein
MVLMSIMIMGGEISDAVISAINFMLELHYVVR